MNSGAEPDAKRATSTRVLVVDDDPTIVLLLEHVLTGLGRTYDAVEDGDRAWRAWELDRHELVVLDVEMPGIDGLEVCRRIRAADPERFTFVLMLTGRDKAVDLEAALEAGADDYVTKPVTGQRLTARLRIAQRRMQSDQARRTAEEELRKARYLAGIGEMSITIQHEINNPLTGILATAELLQQDAKDRGLPTEELRLIVEQALRIGALVKRMGQLKDPKTVEYPGGTRMVDLKEP
ncbi:MAG TPA: response regulator [Gemmatimonadaceae bacterium]|nr:response regulator [Gemmatimonadaceae bacterium]